MLCVYMLRAVETIHAHTYDHNTHTHARTRTHAHALSLSPTHGADADEAEEVDMEQEMQLVLSERSVERVRFVFISRFFFNYFVLKFEFVYCLYARRGAECGRAVWTSQLNQVAAHSMPLNSNLNGP